MEVLHLPIFRLKPPGINTISPGNLFVHENIKFYLAIFYFVFKTPGVNTISPGFFLFAGGFFLC